MKCVLFESLILFIILQCKVKMHPLKKWLKAMNETDPDLPGEEPLRHFKKCLLKIGVHIDRKFADNSETENHRKWNK